MQAGLFLSGGATGNRTPDLYNAIVALSHLSYDPKEAAVGANTLILALKLALGEPKASKSAARVVGRHERAIEPANDSARPRQI